jgi:hypothetical protein
MYNFKVLVGLLGLMLWAMPPIFGQERSIGEVTDYVKEQICGCAKDRVNGYMSRPQIDTIVGGCYVVAINEVVKNGWLSRSFVENPDLLDPMEVAVAKWLGDSCRAIIVLLQRDLSITATPDYFIPTAQMQDEFTLSYPKGQSGFLMWTSRKMTAENPNPLYQVVIDVRWVFDTREKAVAFHKANLDENAEGGAPYTGGKIKLKGVQELYIYNESAKGAAMLKAVGVAQKHHYFLFVVDKTVAKVFVATSDKGTTKKAAKYAKMAVKQLQKVANK